MAEEQRSRDPLARRALTRRAVLGAAALGVGGVAVAWGREVTTAGRKPVAGPSAGGPSAVAPSAPGHGGHSEPPASHATAGQAGVTVIDRDTDVADLHVPAGTTLVFAPDRPVTLTCRGNLVVEGALELAPKDPSVVHRVVFQGVREDRFVGDGMEVLPHDVGLWVMGDGELRLSGHSRTAWVRAAGAVAAGQAVLDLAEEPSGWMPGDELLITATAPPSAKDHAAAIDVVVVRAVDGRRVTTASAVEHDHPAVEVADGTVLTAEVLNLTRNVTVEGTPTGRAHVFVHSKRPQRLRDVSIRHMGPRKDGDGLVGRYGLHFHMCGYATRGSVVERVVVRDCGSHAFVPHGSHGILFRDCISHSTVDDAYWWDQRPGGLPGGPATNDLRIEGCVASSVTSDPPYRGFRLTGFSLGVGRRNSITGCVATSVGGSKDSAGYSWPEAAGDVWGFTDNVSHNNAAHGLFTWQNNHEAHEITGFVGYHNGGSGIAHGAYNNGYRYADSVLFGNAGAGVLLHAVSTSERQIRLERLTIDCAGLADFAVQTAKHTLAAENTTLIEDCSLSGYRVAGVGLAQEDGETEADRLDVVGCTFSGNRFWFSDGVPSSSVVRVQDDGGAGAVRPMSADVGSAVTQWNARVTPIAPFTR